MEPVLAVLLNSCSIAGHAACEFHMAEQLWPLWLVQGALGWLLFSQAGTLVHSPVFRLGSGTAGFMLLSTLIVGFIIYRCVQSVGYRVWGCLCCGNAVRYPLLHTIQLLHRTVRSHPPSHVASPDRQTRFRCRFTSRLCVQQARTVAAPLC